MGFIENFKFEYAGHNILLKGSGYKGSMDENKYLLLYVAKGYQNILYNNKYVRVDEGSFIIFPPLTTHNRFYDGTATAENYYLGFSSKTGNLLDLEIPFELYKFFHIKPSAEIETLFEKILYENQNSMPYSKKYCIMKCMELMIVLYRKSLNLMHNDVLSTKSLSKLVSSIRDSYNQSFSLDKYAKMCNMSKYYFCRTFKQQFGLSPIAYRNSLRIKNAKELLETTNYSINNISERVGFSNVTIFCEAFKRTESISPNQYREAFRKPQNQNTIF